MTDPRPSDVSDRELLEELNRATQGAASSYADASYEGTTYWKHHALSNANFYTLHAARLRGRLLGRFAKMDAALGRQAAAIEILQSDIRGARRLDGAANWKTRSKARGRGGE